MIAALLTALAVSVSPTPAPLDVAALPIPAHTCVAEVLPFEDGSYAAGRLIYDWVTISDGEWLDDLPAIGWSPAWEGTDCILTIPRSAYYD